MPASTSETFCHLADYGPPGLQIWFSDLTQKYFVLMPGSTASIYVVDVRGERQVFLAEHATTASDSVLRELQSVIDSIRID